ncbi:MAG TPA: YceI family protein [Vitreimonas sp.]|uniref:YceI family protein n=1 Tax=Vitreimonas sp. TaxID=3069702 RepID=UPI002D4E967E|nr:YceI family protein [Vitreimonas sp.]HYD89053.1 YceI family protein [Vitreimonas sp.]
MKIWTVAAAAIALAACSQPAQTAPEEQPAQVAVNAPSGTYQLDPNHTTVTVRAKHFGLSNYQLRFNGVTGALNFNAEDPEQSRVEATVAANTLDTPYIGATDFDAELQNSEWLDAAQFPTATFRSTAIERTGPNTARVTGDLTIRNITHPITLEVTYNASHASHPMGFPGALIGFSARGTFLRSQYGLNVLQPSAAGASDGVSDEVELLIEAEFTQPAQPTTTPAPAQPAEPVN